MGHPAGNRSCCQGVGRQRPYYQIPSTPSHVHGHQEDSVLTCITEDHLGGAGGFFSVYGPVQEVSTVKSKSSIVNSDMEFMVTLTRKRFNEVPKVITCGGQNICVVVEGSCPHFCFCCAVGHIAKLCPGKKSGTAASTIDNGAVQGRSA